MKLKFYFFLLSGLIISFNSFSQKDTAKFGINFSGFVNSQLIYDTRQTVGGRETMLLLYPENVLKDRNGKDINSNPSFNQLAMITRLTGKAWGPDVWGAKSSALFEGDFTGQTNNDNNGFRLRHAYIKLNWENQELLLGQYWHPFDVPEMLPSTLSLNTGAPFHAFSRHIQVRYSKKIGNLNIIGVAASQRDYSNEGPSGNKSDYMRNAIIPNLHLQLHYKLNQHLIGAGIDFKSLKPRLKTDSLYTTDKKINSTSFIAFAKIVTKNFDVKLQGSLGQNLSEHTMLGGYFEKSYDTINGEISYGNSATMNYWIDISSKKSKWNLGIFTGFTKNLGYSDNIANIKFNNNSTFTGKFYGRGNNIDKLFRVSPRITYTSGQFNIGSEFEYTVAYYGIPNEKGEIAKSDDVANFRVLISATYNF
jgi:hypothetical protein